MPRKSILEQREVSECQKAYTAGIVDGEGTLYIHRCTTAKHNKHGIPHYQSCVSVTSTDEILIDWLVNVWGGTKTIYKPSQIAKNSKKTPYRWQCSGDRISFVCNNILPYLVIKKEQAKILLEFRNSITEGQKLNEGKRMNQSLPQEILDYREQLFQQLKTLHCRNNNLKTCLGLP